MVSSALSTSDWFDPDDDDDTAEPVPHDMLGRPRVVGAAPDLGAYERP